MYIRTVAIAALLAAVALAGSYQCVRTADQFGHYPRQASDEPPPPAPAGTTIEIWWMERPLMHKEILGMLKLKHVAVGFVVKGNPSINWTVEYEAAYGFKNTFFPHATTNAETGACELTPCNHGLVHAFAGIKDEWSHEVYKTSNMSIIGEISSEGFNTFLKEWMPDVLANPRVYDLFAVQGRGGKAYLPFYTCQTFNIEVLEALIKYGAKYQCGSTNSVLTNQMLMSRKPVEADPATDEKVCKFFSIFPDMVTATFPEIEEALQKLMTWPNHYTYSGAKYYKLKPQLPYIEVGLSKVVLPGCGN